MILNKFSLNGKTAIVTGASGGIGKVMALALAESGADIVIAARNLEKLNLLRDQICSLNRKCLVCRLDVKNLDSIEMMAKDTINAFDKIDILVNNAGINIRKMAIDLTENEWDEILDTNLKGYFFCAKIVAREMAKHRKGKIVNISSLRSVIAPPKASAYTASKGGVTQLTKALAVEWSEFNIRVNAIAPGYMETDLTAHFKQNQKDLYESIRERTPLKRWGRPEDLVGALIYLSSDASDFMTGQTLYVDGGYMLT